MPRLGELLVATGLLTVEQVEQALRAQVMWGGRLGTNLIELGYLDLDALSSTLGKQHKLPAAMARHFEKADRDLQHKLSADVAERYSAVPLLRHPEQQKVVVAMVDLIDKRGIAIIADELEMEPGQIVPAIAAELRIRYHLERVYRIPRGSRFLRARGKTNPPFPQFEIAQIEFEDSEVGIPLPGEEMLAESPRPAPKPQPEPEKATESSGSLDVDFSDDAPPPPPPVHGGPPPLELEPLIDPLEAAIEDLGARMPTVETAPEPEPAPEPVDDYSSIAILDEVVDEEPAQRADTTPQVDDDELPPEEGTGRHQRRYVRSITDEPGTESERQALARIAIRRVAVAPGSTGQTLGEATRAIRRSTGRDRVAELVVAALERFIPACEAGVLLVVRGDLAIGWKGFSRSAATLPEVGVPLDEPGMAPRAIQRCSTVRMPSSDLGPIDQLLLVSLGQQAGDLAIVPVSIASQVMCLIALAGPPEMTLASAESIAAAAGAAFARLMRDAAR